LIDGFEKDHGYFLPQDEAKLSVICHEETVFRFNIGGLILRNFSAKSGQKLSFLSTIF